MAYNNTWSNSVWIILAIVVLGALVLWYAASDNGGVAVDTTAPATAPADQPATGTTTPPPATAPTTPPPATTTPGGTAPQ